MTAIYVGAYTNRSPIGIRAYRTRAGDPHEEPELVDVVDDLEHASYVAVHPAGHTLYAVSETSGSGGGEIAAYRTEPDGTLAPLGRVRSGGDAPCHLGVDPRGRSIRAANYGSGTVAAYELRTDGTLGEALGVERHRGSGPTSRQAGPHAHCVIPDPTGRWWYAADLGTDQILRSAPGEPTAVVELAAGSGPRHLRFHPTLPLLFAVCELDSTVVMFEHDPATGTLTALTTVSTLPPGDRTDSIAADLAVHPRGRHVYASNRGHDSVVVLELGADDRSLRPRTHVPAAGRTPRGFGLDPTGGVFRVAHQDDDSIATFAIDSESGIPEHVATIDDVAEPVCIVHGGAP